MACKPPCAVCDRLRVSALGLVDEGREVTAQALADRAGVSPEAATEHYPTAAACLHAAYEQVSGELRRVFEEAFSGVSPWEEALATARRTMLERLAAQPGAARLCFEEALGGDRELQVLRDRHRRWTIDFVAPRSELSSVQAEMLIGATFHELSAAVDRGESARLPELEPRLAELVTLFEPATQRAQPASSTR